MLECNNLYDYKYVYVCVYAEMMNKEIYYMIEEEDNVHREESQIQQNVYTSLILYYIVSNNFCN